jgi:hypothetical protein
MSRLMTTGLVWTLDATAVEQTGPFPALRAKTLRAWIATTNRLEDSIACTWIPDRRVYSKDQAVERQEVLP